MKVSFNKVICTCMYILSSTIFLHVFFGINVGSSLILANVPCSYIHVLCMHHSVFELPWFRLQASPHIYLVSSITLDTSFYCLIIGQQQTQRPLSKMTQCTYIRLDIPKNYIFAVCEVCALVCTVLYVHE